MSYLFLRLKVETELLELELLFKEPSKLIHSRPAFSRLSLAVLERSGGLAAPAFGHGARDLFATLLAGPVFT